MTDDLVQRLRRTYRKEFAATGSMFGDTSNRLRPFPILATEVLFNPDGRDAAAMARHMALTVAKILFARIVMEKEGFDMPKQLLDAVGELALAIKPHYMDAEQRKRIASAIRNLVDVAIALSGKDDTQ